MKMCVPPAMVTPMVACPPQWLPPNTRPKPVDHPSPFSASANQPVLTVHHLLRANKDITLNVNPSIAAAHAGSTFPLIADLRVAPELKVWLMPKKGEEKKVETWRGIVFSSSLTVDSSVADWLSRMVFCKRLGRACDATEAQPHHAHLSHDRG